MLKISTEIEILAEDVVMGWWNIPDQKDAVIGDAVLDSIRHFLKEFSHEYIEDLGRKPTLLELEYALSLAFKVNVDDEIASGMEELEIKQVVLKTAKRPKRFKPILGDLFAFRYDEQRYCFGRLISKLNMGMVAEIYDYFSAHPIFDPNYADKWLISPVILNPYGLFECRSEGEWLIIDKTPNYVVSEKFNDVFFVTGTPGKLQAVRVDNSRFDISQEEAIGHRMYAYYDDAHIKELITDALKNK
ncbi:Imm26 family immunity protein [Iodobacter arcticus]|uniref:Imm26 family immunity protein n=1 Tax=Iodobacter arcticus TaxID=590593 RepID=A0ABW2R3W1_9NEIS